MNTGMTLIEQLRGVDGLRTDVGLLNAGNLEETYAEVLRTFCADFDGQIALLAESLERRDWSSFSVRMHGLRGALAGIGAQALAEKAHNLELASKNADGEYCVRTAPPVIEAMTALREALGGTSLMDAPAEGESAAPEEGRKVILAVDDMKTTLAAMKNILQRTFTVLLAESADAADKILATVKADLILLDIEMPEVSGFDYLARLREDEEKAKIPVIFVTSHADSELISRALAAGVDGYVVKPFVPGVLIRRIEMALGII